MEKTVAHSPEHTLTALQWKKDKKEKKKIKLLNILIITCLLFKRKKYLSMMKEHSCIL